MWREGSILIKEEVYHYWVKQYAEPSQYGIDGGRISKLEIRHEGEVMCSYDRGWDIEPEDENTQIALAILMMDYNK